MKMQSGLPVRVAAFVGRAHERAKVADLVAEARVVTLTGSGGCGKTRPAVEVAGDVASRFSDGACWVDLQGVNEPRLIAPAIGGRWMSTSEPSSDGWRCRDLRSFRGVARRLPRPALTRPESA